MTPEDVEIEARWLHFESAMRLSRPLAWEKSNKAYWRRKARALASSAEQTPDDASGMTP